MTIGELTRKGPLKMPERTPVDGPVSLYIVDGTNHERLAISVTTDGREQIMIVTEHNAWRVLGLLSFMLKVPLSKAAEKVIRF
jgi:hypothetical protein